MNQNTLSLLGCSGSLALILLVGNAADADTVVPQTGSPIQIFPATQRTELVTPQVTPEATPEANPEYGSIDPYSDTVGDLAVEKFKCDCPPCRIAVVQMLQTGQLSL